LGSPPCWPLMIVPRISESFNDFYVQTMYIVSGQFECWRFDPETDERVESVVCGPGDSIYVPILSLSESI